MTSADRPDLAALAHRLRRRLMTAEGPILERDGLTMWGYSILLALAEEPAGRQADLAVRIRRDQTRLIGDLDALQDRGLIERRTDPADRRSRLVEISPRGRHTLSACRTRIRRMEAAVLAELPAGNRATFLRALQRLATSAES